MAHRGGLHERQNLGEGKGKDSLHNDVVLLS